MGKTSSGRGENFGRFIGTSPAMQAVYSKIQRIAPSDAPVFITGRTGTGKEICAQSVHTYSRRNIAPFVALNCAALPPNMIDSALFGHVRGAYTNADRARDGAIARAEGGTLFLDEVCEMPLESQSKLLRFTQKLEYQKLGSDGLLKANVRLVCATNCDPQQRVRQKLFREDLYYRLCVSPIILPDLKDRDGDVIDIAYYFMMNFSKKYNKLFQDFSQAAMDLLQTHDWPGNVRELENLMHEIVSLYDGKLLTESMIPEHVGRFQTKKAAQERDVLLDAHMPLWKIEKRAIENVLHGTKGNVQKAAQILDVAPSTIYRKMQAWKDYERTS